MFLISSLGLSKKTVNLFLSVFYGNFIKLVSWLFVNSMLVLILAFLTKVGTISMTQNQKKMFNAFIANVSYILSILKVLSTHKTMPTQSM